MKKVCWNFLHYQMLKYLCLRYFFFHQFSKIKNISSVLSKHSPTTLDLNQAFILTASGFRHTAWITTFSCNKQNLCFDPISVVIFWSFLSFLKACNLRKGNAQVLQSNFRKLFAFQKCVFYNFLDIFFTNILLYKKNSILAKELSFCRKHEIYNS